MQAVIQREAPLDYGVWNSVSPQCLALMQAVLHKDPAQRISAADALQHDWFRHHGIGALFIPPLPPPPSLHTCILPLLLLYSTGLPKFLCGA